MKRTWGWIAAAVVGSAGLVAATVMPARAVQTSGCGLGSILIEKNHKVGQVVSATLNEVDWNAELARGDLGQSVQALKDEPGEALWVGGVTLPLALADLGLIDEYEFVVQPVLAGHGPTLLAGLRERIQLELVDRRDFRSGAVAMRYRPARTPD